MEKSRGARVSDAIGRDAAVLSAVEVGLGSVLHGFKIPFSGHFLSLNQAFLLSRATLKLKDTGVARRAGAQVSSIAAILKSLSPAGKKLTPMLAISAQGLLFSLGTIVFGPNILGIIAGSLISSLWAFIQPVMVYYIIFGKNIIHVADYFYDKTKEAVTFERDDLLLVLGVVLGLKLVLALVAAVLASCLPDATVSRYEGAMLRAGRERRKRALSYQPAATIGQKAALALKDLFNPLFIVSFLLTAFFFAVSEAKSSTVIWGLLRPIAAGFILFFVIRAVSFERVLRRLDATFLSGFATAFRRAVEFLKQV